MEPAGDGLESSTGDQNARNDEARPGLRTFEDAGIVAFRSPPKVFLKGRIKATPDDFEVRELGSSGEGAADVRVNERAPLVPPAPPVACQSPGETGEERRPVGKKRRISTPQAAEVVGKELSERLEALQAGEETMVTFDSLEVASLATKRGRTRCLGALRSAFPLVTFRKRADSEDSVGFEAAVSEEMRQLQSSFGTAAVSALAVMRTRGPEEDPGTFADLPVQDGVDKSERREIHRLLARLDKRLETSFISGAGNEAPPVIRCSWKRHVRRRAQAPAATRTLVLRFCLRKRDVEASRAVQLLSQAARIHPSQFDTAGIKDKCAVTYQYVTVRLPSTEARRVAEQLVRVGRKDATGQQCSGVLVDHPVWVERPLSRGSAMGNAFRVVVKEVQVDNTSNCNGSIQDAVVERTKVVRARGFVNYFGAQRVGLPACAAPPRCADRRGSPMHTSLVGRALCKGDLLLAMDMIMSGQLGLSEQAVEEVGSYTYVKGNGKSREAGKLSSEEDFGRALWVSKRDVEGALRFLPSYCHKERALLHGVQRHGSDKLEAAFKALGHDALTYYLHAYQSLIFNLAATERLRLSATQYLPGDLIALGDGGGNVEVLTRERCDEMNSLGHTESALAKVCLPLVGTNVDLPRNGVGDFIRLVLQADGTESMIQPDSRQLSGRLRGGYRNLLSMPQGLEVTTSSSQGEFAFSFELPPGSFATICLREILGSYPSG